jgi:hypothetical protein
MIEFNSIRPPELSSNTIYHHTPINKFIICIYGPLVAPHAAAGRNESLLQQRRFGHPFSKADFCPSTRQSVPDCKDNL